MFLKSRNVSKVSFCGSLAAYSSGGNPRTAQEASNSDGTAAGSTVGSTQYDYDGSGNVTGIAHLDSVGNVLDGFVYAYDAANRLTSESDYGVAENPVAPISGVSSPSVLDAAILASMDASDASTDVSALTGGVAISGASGSPSLPGMTPSTNYSYDADGEVIGAGTQAYQYDANGNRINPGYKIGPDNQILSDGTWDYTYDADGNRIGKTNIATGVSWTYGYDDANQMTSAVEYAADGKTILAAVTYKYDVFGDRIEQDTYDVSTHTWTVQRYGYDGQNVWADLDASNHLETRYLHGDAVDQILASVQNSVSKTRCQNSVSVLQNSVSVLGGKTRGTKLGVSSVFSTGKTRCQFCFFVQNSVSVLFFRGPKLGVSSVFSRSKTRCLQNSVSVLFFRGRNMGTKLGVSSVFSTKLGVSSVFSR